MWLISFIDRYKKKTILGTLCILFILWYLSTIWAKKPIQPKVAIEIFMFGYMFGLITLLLIKYVFKVQEGTVGHYVRLSWIYSVIFCGVAIAQIITKFSMSIPTEVVFALPGVIIVPNGYINKILGGGNGC